MTIELVDGRAGTAHISSEDKAIIHQAKFGSDDMVYGWGDAMSCTMSSTTKAVIGTGCASIQGLDWHITAAETVAIANGSQGMKRNDIIAAHYHRDSSTGVETVALTVLKGTPNATAAADPTVPSGKILDGATDAYQPLWRIPLDGITVGTPVCLYNKRTALWDSVTLYNASGFTVIRCGHMMTIRYEGAISNASYVTVTCPYTLPDGYRPRVEMVTAMCVRDGQTSRMLVVNPNGSIRVQNMGAAGSASTCFGCLTYPLA